MSRLPSARDPTTSQPGRATGQSLRCQNGTSKEELLVHPLSARRPNPLFGRGNRLKHDREDVRLLLEHSVVLNVLAKLPQPGQCFRRFRLELVLFDELRGLVVQIRFDGFAFYLFRLGLRLGRT